MYSLVGS